MINRRTDYHQGAVAIFSVVFATLLIMIVTVSFLTLMIGDQRQSTNADLSESAYDSAMAGVEDAKRLIAERVGCYGQSSARCQVVNGLFSGAHGRTECTAIIDAGIAGNSGDTEVKIGGTDSEALNQAYTCVEISMNTDDYLGTLASGSSGSSMIPLRGASSFSQVRISWYDQSDRSGRTASLSSGAASVLPLPPQVDWSRETPPVLRATITRPGSSFEAAHFNTARSATAFLYPASNGLDDTSVIGGSLDMTTHDAPRDLNNGTKLSRSGPKAIHCSDSLQLLQRYFCRATLDLGSNTNSAFLTLGSIYNKASYRVELLDSSGDVVLFNNVQPSVDSTGRASDIFRRVDARVELRQEVVYPDAALSTVGDICKDFSLTDNVDDFTNSCSW